MNIWQTIKSADRAALTEALRLYREWTGESANPVRMAHRIGLGRIPVQAAARELGYRLALSCRNPRAFPSPGNLVIGL